MKKAIVISGPTASGKSALAVEKALSLDTEVIGADSRQIYRHMSVITAVPNMDERRGVSHRLVEILEPEEYLSAATWCDMALTEIEEVFTSHDEVVICGGSMLYVDALIRGLDDLPNVPESVRHETLAEYNEKGLSWAQQELERLDPEYYAQVDLNNGKRVIHAIELIRTSGKPYSQMRTGAKTKRPFEIELILLQPEREELFRRINKRVEQMIELGAIEEARQLYSKRHLNSLNAVGFRELFAYLEGKMSLEEAIAKWQRNTRVYAKKQLLWARHRNEESQ